MRLRQLLHAAAQGATSVYKIAFVGVMLIELWRHQRRNRG